MDALTLFIVLAVVAAVWILKAVAAGVRDELADRTTAWLLPEDQPWTFRIAQLLAAFAKHLAPTGVWYLDAGAPPAPPPLLWQLRLRWWACDWQEPAAAVAELEADLGAEQRVIAPVRLVAPLLRRACYLRVRTVALAGAGSIAALFFSIFMTCTWVITLIASQWETRCQGVA